ncbi:RNA polymerase sigma factor [Rhizobium cremeum]|uniref:RNA polymerase sigma factor n=1 Tax=Rhizobium cremeum TaxID=2813827 RepID=UPI0013B021F7|nr:RNA polymerase sigma factor [Rhizobium cremeum]MCJ7995726.1 RNA polymerase sigma factor [Rhizobium cremeum]MCJ8001224.1 RNA polymerase sigma factor [Rhizobium cremeum]
MNERPDLRFGLYTTHRPVLIDYASRLLGTRDGAEDIVQEAFLRFLPATTSNDRALPPRSYLFRIVRNLVIDRHRRRKLEARQSEQDAPDWAAPQAIPTPEESILFCESMRRAMDMIASLPEKQRIALEMVRFGGYSVEDVAAHLGVSLRTAYRLVEDAMIAVTTRLRQDTDDLPPAGRKP